MRFLYLVKRLQEHRQQRLYLIAAGTGQKSNVPFPIFRRKGLFNRLRNYVKQGMSYENRIAACLFVNLFLKWEDDEYIFCIFCNFCGTSRTAGPYLRAYVPVRRNIPVSGHSQHLIIEAVKVHRYHAGRLFFLQIMPDKPYQLEPEHEMAEWGGKSACPDGNEIVNEVV